MSSPSFLVLSEPSSSRWIFEIKTLDGGFAEAWLVANVGPAFLLGASVGDFVEVGRDELVIRLGQEWPRPDDPRAAAQIWAQHRAKEPPP